ncbi:MAG: glycosidase [Verrucomicrobiota bacterium]|nr:glycosidase [Verrucomicrobiota bacterium]
MTLEAITLRRCPQNPVVRPGLYDWRRAVVFNPAVIHYNNHFYLFERAGGGLRPFHNSIGALVSDDGIHFNHLSEEPVFTPAMCGSKYGSVQDPRIVQIGDTFYMTFAYRPYAWSCNPTGLGVPQSHETEYPGVTFKSAENQTRSGVAVSKDLVHWAFHSWTSDMDRDDRNNILFPEKIGGRFALLRRPQRFVGTNTEHDAEPPCIQLSYSEDLIKWTEPQKVIAPAFAWEDNRIGGSAPPIKTEHGWLTTYHGVENQDTATRRVCYRMGLMLLDLKDPTRVLARCPHPIMEPTEYYEKFGLLIPNVIFPTAAVVVDGLVHIYYGVCDTAICLATVPLNELLQLALRYKSE